VKASFVAVNVKVPKETDRVIRVEAQRRMLSKSDVIREVLTAWARQWAEKENSACPENP